MADTWASRTNQSASRHAHGGAATSTKAYSLGGQSGTTKFDHCLEYDPVGNAWTSKTAMPATRRYPLTTGYNDKVYVIGGWNDAGSATATTWVFDPGTNAWATLTAAPTDFALTGCAEVSGVIYCPTTGTAFYAYTVATDAWAAKTNLPAARDQRPVVVALDSKVYVIGGRSGGAYVATGVVYDPATDSWASIASMPAARAFASGFAVNGKLHIVGGSSNGAASGASDSHYEYDPATDAWTTRAVLPAIRYDGAAACVGTRPFFFAGLNSSTVATPNNYEYDPIPVAAATRPRLRGGQTIVGELRGGQRWN